MTQRSKISLNILIISVAFFSACSTVGKPVFQQPVVVEDPTAEVNRLENHIIKARQDQLNVLSPDWFAKAELSYLKAKGEVERGAEISNILENVEEAHLQLQTAEETAKIARTVLVQVIESRSMARTAGATRLGKDYAGVEEQFLELTRAIEQNDIRYAKKNAAKVNESYRALELRSIKIETIGEVRAIIEQAEGQGAKKFVPTSLALAEQYLIDTDDFISLNPYAKQEMHKKAQEALTMARRTISLTNQSKKLARMQPEETALWMEGILKRITTQLSARDMRDQEFKTQEENILGSIKSLQNDNRFMAEKLKSNRKEIEDMKTSHKIQIDALDQRIAFLEGKTKEEQITKEHLLAEQRAIEQKLTAERQFNQLFIEVQDYFDADEAEVYKQGNHLVVRLSGIQFPVGKAIIMPGNYQLLSKVQRAIRNFGEPSVVIEGHTDSTGTNELNQHLSQQRAEAVRDYFIANQTLPADKVVALGYGSDRPLASNETPEGRAINRRIDVIVDPETRSAQW